MYIDIVLDDMRAVAKDVASILTNHRGSSFVIHLIGDMGAGKTTFTKFLASELKVNDDVQSPTFTLMREYDIPQDGYNKYEKMLHVDAYRFDHPDEGKVLMLSKRLKDKNIILIEWPMKMSAPKYDMIVKIEKHKEDENKRSVFIKNRIGR